MKSIIQQLQHKVSIHPEKKLFVFLDVQGNITEQYTYATFYQRIESIASNLLQIEDLKKGDRLLLAYPPGLEMICAFFGCVRAGFIPVPVYPPTAYGFQAAVYKMKDIAMDCSAKAVLTTKQYHWSYKFNTIKKNVRSLNWDSNPLNKLKWLVTENFKQPLNNVAMDCSEELLFIQYTSGSTSKPKGVMVTHENILHNCSIVIGENPVAVTWLPQYHDMGLIGYYLYSALSGGTTYGFSPIDFIKRPALWLESISKYKAHCSSAPNFAFEYCLRPEKISDSTYNNLDLSSLNFLMAAAEPVNPVVYNQFINRFEPYGLKPKSFFAAYGMAEFTLAVTNHGRHSVSVDKSEFKKDRIQFSKEEASVQIMSCGKAIGDTVVKIVDKHTNQLLPDGEVGEVWLKGKSKCAGYWNNPTLTNETFHAKLNSNEDSNNDYLKTGDLGFMKNGELFICGRIKDMIIVRGLNIYPQDIERLVQEVSPEIRKGCVAAVGVATNHSEKIVIVAELKNKKLIPDSDKIISTIRKNMNVEVNEIIFIEARTISKTSSGKIARHQVKEKYEQGKLKVIQQINLTKSNDVVVEDEVLNDLKIQYGLRGNESLPLAEIGIDSMDMVLILQYIQNLFKQYTNEEVLTDLDISILQKISVADLFDMVKQLKGYSKQTFNTIQTKIRKIKDTYIETEQKQMIRDASLSFTPSTMNLSKLPDKESPILLTGGTGFFGPFLLKSLLEQTDQDVYVLVRAKNEQHGRQRLLNALDSTRAITDTQLNQYRRRIIPVVGDMSKPNLGLSMDKWNHLASTIGSIYNNGAIVNYLYNYEQMRSVNVDGTNEILRLAFAKRKKEFNHISTTFMFGWAVKGILYETDTNDDLELLDFGYSQSKWVSEQIVKDAQNYGLDARIFRPALISPSVNGGGENFDIAIRLFSFMIKNCLGVEALNQISLIPADVAANNIVAISNLKQSIGKTFHVTRDEYSNMSDIQSNISNLTGKEFKNFPIPSFVDQVVNTCTENDLLFPLLDFFTKSEKKISAMEYKRYDSSNYKKYRNLSTYSIPDPTLEETIRGMLLFMGLKGIIDFRFLASKAA